MEINLNNQQNSKKAHYGLKLGLILLLSLILLIPRFLIQNLVDERQYTETSAAQEVFDKWSGEQRFIGPMIFLPRAEKNGTDLYLLPENHDVKCNVNTKTLKRGLFDFTVYESVVELTGTFTLPNETNVATLKEHACHKAELLIGIQDLKGLTDNPKAVFDGATHTLSQSNKKLGNGNVLSININMEKILEGGKVDFTITIPIKGSERISFIPVGRTSTAKITSNCSTPSFDGNYLPTHRNVTDKGFEADWKILAINRSFPQVVNGAFSWEDLSGSEFGVTLKVPVEQYQQTTRTIKYAFLIILLTFAVVFFVEIRKQTPIHPVQYLLIGIALILFYTLLLSFSEHLTFGLSYAIAAVMTIGLITIYMGALLKDKRTALTIGALLLALYIFIYVLLQLESYALLIGSIGLFIILGIAMYASQKIDWYKKRD